ncbi:adenosine deaminase [Spirochaetia bacterium 38H-sp]|uniref:adenosine deaminase n=1 Tax=Rarispira pelagica TaxID=3141764 RepID=A0ABU9U987_9SPIR
MSQKKLQKEVIRQFPKVELHRHLEGTFAGETLHRLALKNGLDVPKTYEEFKKTAQFPKDSEPDFLKFLSKFRTDWYKSLGDIEEIVYQSVKNLSNDGIFYIELRFSPEHFALNNNFNREEVTKIIVRAGNQAAKEEGFNIRYLITFNRNKQNQQQMLELYNKIKKLEIEEIVGIDLAGDEIHYGPELFIDFFKQIKKDNRYGITVHAGEVTPAEEIWKAIKNLNATRIGHGTAAIKDEKLQNYLKEKFIILEQCITSNYQTGSWTDSKNHPFGTLFKKGVPVTLNSDDPFIQDTDLTDDYIKAIEYFSLSFEDLKKINHYAIEGSFLSETEKKELLTKFDKKAESFKKMLI